MDRGTIPAAAAPMAARETIKSSSVGAIDVRALNSAQAKVAQTITRSLPMRSPKGPYNNCMTPYDSAKAEITREASPVVAWNSRPSAISIESQIRMAARLPNAARPISRKVVLGEFIGLRRGPYAALSITPPNHCR